MLFRETLKVKMQYEELLKKLFENAEVAPYLSEAAEIMASA